MKKLWGALLALDASPKVGLDVDGLEGGVLDCWPSCGFCRFSESSTTFCKELARSESPASAKLEHKSRHSLYKNAANLQSRRT